VEEKKGKGGRESCVYFIITAHVECDRDRKAFIPYDKCRDTLSPRLRLSSM
jgi:hypothetical protein